VQENEVNSISNSTDTKAKNKAKKDFNDWLLNPEMNKLDRIGSSPNIEEKDRPVFNLKLRDTTPTPRPQITTSPHVDFKVEEGSYVLITNRVESDASRASMHPDADVVEMKYIFLPIDAAIPDTPDECPNTETSSKALFRFLAGMENAGKRMVAFLRWKNNTEPAKSGPWNQAMNIIISN
jgi:hypothetical protein